MAYWTGFFTDDDTGEGLGVFYNINHQAVRLGVVQYIAWFGTYGNPSRQRFRCTSADGTTHRFAGVLPRLRVEGDCQHCDNEVYRHQGPLLTSNYDFHLRLTAKRSSTSAPG